MVVLRHVLSQYLHWLDVWIRASNAVVRTKRHVLQPSCAACSCAVVFCKPCDGLPAAVRLANLCTCTARVSVASKQSKHTGTQQASLPNYNCSHVTACPFPMSRVQPGSHGSRSHALFAVSNTTHSYGREHKMINGRNVTDQQGHIQLQVAYRHGGRPAYRTMLHQPAGQGPNEGTLLGPHSRTLLHRLARPRAQMSKTVCYR